jgi:endonuclease YncB( thermonuclease family)
MRRVTSTRPSPARAWRRWYGGRITILGVLALLAIHVVTSPTETSSAARTTSSFEGAVSRVVDGDTLWIDGQSVRIRIWGLDAPETRQPRGRCRDMSRMMV